MGREGKWIAEAVGTEAWEASVTAYSSAYTKTMQFFRGRNLIPSDIDEVRLKIDTCVSQGVPQGPGPDIECVCTLESTGILRRC